MKEVYYRDESQKENDKQKDQNWNCCACTSVQGRMPLGGVFCRLFVPFWELFQ